MVFMYQFFFVHSAVDGHFGCFHALAIANIAAVQVCQPVSFRFWSSQVTGPVVGLPDQMVVQFIAFQRSSILFSWVTLTSFPISRFIGGYAFLHNPSAVILCRLFSDFHSSFFEVIFLCGLDLHSSNYLSRWPLFHVLFWIVFSIQDHEIFVRAGVIYSPAIFVNITG